MKINNKRGATLIELAFSLPLFLAFIFIAIFFGLVWNAKTSLDSAVTNGVRLAFTRGDRNLVGRALIPDIESYSASGSMNPRLTALLSTPSEAPFADAYYKSMAINIFGRSFEALPPRYIYAMVYTMQSLTAGIGEGMMRFPCDPSLPTAISQGCLQCRFIHPSSRTTSAGAPQMGQPGFDWSYLGLACRYRLSNAVVGPIQGILSYLTGATSFDPLLLQSRSSFYVEQILDRPL